MLEKLRKVIILLIFLQCFTGAFKSSYAGFGIEPLFSDITFLIVFSVAVYFITLFFLAPNTTKVEMVEKIWRLKSIFVFTGILWLSYFINPSPGGFNKAFIFTLTIIPMCSIFVGLLKEKDMKSVLFFLFLFGLLLLIVTIIFRAADPFGFITSGFKEYPGRTWTYIVLGKIMGIASLFAFVTSVNLISKKPLTSLFYAIFSIASCLAIVYASERASPIFILIFLLFYTININLKKGFMHKESVFANLIIFLFFIAILALLNLEEGEMFRHRWEIALGFKGREIDERIDLVKGKTTNIFLNRIQKSPLIGVGPGNFYGPSVEIADPKGDYPHNIIYEIGAETGMIGLLSFLWILIIVYKGIKKSSKRIDWYETGIATILILFFFLANALKSGNINGNRILWLFVSFFLYMAYSNDKAVKKITKT